MTHTEKPQAKKPQVKKPPANDDHKGLPDAETTAQEAVAYARAEVQSGDTSWTRLCLKFVRTAWGLPAVEDTAAHAWDHAHKRHQYSNVHDIPFGAPVFSQRPGANYDDAGHVFIAGGYNKAGQRIFRSNDIKVLGGISVCQIEDFTEKWGHRILGWTEDINGYHLNLPDPPKRNERK